MRTIGFVWMFLSSILLFAESYELFPAGVWSFGRYGNAEVIKRMDSQRPALQVRLGGVNSVRSGAAVLGGKAFAAIPANGEFNCLTLTFKGSGKPGEFVMLLRDIDGGEWCWNGVRWQGTAAISSAVDCWQTRVFRFEDFRPTNKKAKGGKPDPHRLEKIDLAIGKRLDDPAVQRADFLLSRLALEKDASPRMEFVGNSGKTEEMFAVEEKKAELPAGTVLRGIPEREYRRPAWVDWDLRNAWQNRSERRCEVSLNNYWQFLPVPESNAERLSRTDSPMPERKAIPPADGSWFYVLVPGTWDTQSGTDLMDAERKRVEKFQNVSLSNFAQGWYRRSLNIPAEWKGKRILLKMNALSDRAQVFVNGVPAGEGVRSAGVVDLTSYLICGEGNDLVIFVQYDGFPFAKSHKKYQEFKEHPTCGDWWFGWHNGPGLSDDISLLVMPEKEILGDLRIVSSVEKRELSADAVFENRGTHPAEYCFRAAVFDGEKELLRFPEHREKIPAGKGKRLFLRTEWKQGEFWTPENPKLYRLVFSVFRDGILLDQVSDRFGFRELTIRGSDFLLNGVPRRLKFFSNQTDYTKWNDETIRDFFLLLKEMHFNGIIFESLDRRVVRIADELGVMIAMRHVFPKLVRNGVYLPGVDNIGYPSEIYLSGKLLPVRREFERTIRGIVSKFRNDPSIVIWAINPLLCYNPEWINPNEIDRERAQNDLTTATLLQEAWLRSLDPSRLVLQSMGSNTGAIIAVNPYPTFSNPIEEWENWPMRWAQRKKKPLLLEEIALPFWYNFSNWEDSVSGQGTEYFSLRQLYYEQAARYFGDAVYERSSPDTDDRCWNLSSGGKIVRDGGQCSRMDPVALATKCLYAGRCLKAWRMYGISGIWPFDDPREFFSFFRGSRPAVHRDVTAPGLKLKMTDLSPRSGINELFRTLQEAQQPFLAFLGGASSLFTEREHLFFAGEEVEKQMLFSNDAPETASVRAEWSLIERNSGKTVASGSWNGTLAPAAVKHVPFRFRMSRPGEYELRFLARSGQTVCRDSFRLTAFPPRTRPKSHKMVRLFDVHGKTEALLKRAGVPFTKDLSARTETILVGALSLNEEFLRQAARLGIDRQVREGANLVIFAQNMDSPMKEYLEERRSRMVSVKDSAHPILKGIPESGFSWWRGEPEKSAAYPASASSFVNRRFMHWGSRGTVATFVQDKPDSGRFRVLLDCDADLSRSALMEYFVGRGRILFCMLDLEERYGTDPVASEVADRLFGYLDHPQKLPVRNACFSGKAEAGKVLDGLGFRLRKIGNSVPDDCGLLVVGPGSPLSLSSLRSFAEKGGILLLLKPGPALEKGLFGENSRKERVRLARLDLPGDWTRGLGNSDCYFNPVRELPTYGDARIARFKQLGKGGAGALLILPEDFTQNSSVVKARRILSVLLTNLGAPAEDRFSVAGFSAPRTDFSGQAVPFAIDPEQKGEMRGWHKMEFDDSAWKKIRLGTYWENQGITMQNPKFQPRLGAPYDGDAFYRIAVVIPESWKGRKLYLEAGPIDDLDRTWFNGVMIGETTEAVPKYWELVRRYPIPSESIRWGKKNVIALRVRDLRYHGGILGVFRVTDGSASGESALFYPLPSRLIYRFDPNAWRQW